MRGVEGVHTCVGKEKWAACRLLVHLPCGSFIIVRFSCGSWRRWGSRSSFGRLLLPTPSIHSRYRPQRPSPAIRVLPWMAFSIRHGREGRIRHPHCFWSASLGCNRSCVDDEERAREHFPWCESVSRGASKGCPVPGDLQNGFPFWL